MKARQRLLFAFSASRARFETGFFSGFTSRLLPGRGVLFFNPPVLFSQRVFIAPLLFFPFFVFFFFRRLLGRRFNVLGCRSRQFSPRSLIRRAPAREDRARRELPRRWVSSFLLGEITPAPFARAFCEAVRCFMHFAFARSQQDLFLLGRVVIRGTASCRATTPGCAAEQDEHHRECRKPPHRLLIGSVLANRKPQ